MSTTPAAPPTPAHRSAFLTAHRPARVKSSHLDSQSIPPLRPVKIRSLPTVRRRPRVSISSMCQSVRGWSSRRKRPGAEARPMAVRLPFVRIALDSFTVPLTFSSTCELPSGSRFSVSFSFRLVIAHMTHIIRLLLDRPLFAQISDPESNYWKYGHDRGDDEVSRQALH